MTTTQRDDPTGAWIRRLARRVGAAVYLEEASACAGTALALAALALLLARRVWPAAEPWASPATGLGILGIALLTAALRARRRLPPRGIVAAWADRYAGAGGLLLATIERPGGAWADRVSERLTRTPPPLPGWAPGRALRRAALPMLLFGCALAVPTRTIAQNAARLGSAGTMAVARVEQAVLTLAASGALGKEEETALRRDLEALRRDAGSFDATEWEALDSVAERLQAQVQASRLACERAQTALAALQAAAAAGEGLSATHDAIRQLEQAIEALRDSGIEGAGGMPDWPAEAALAAGVSPDAETLRRLLDQVEPYRPMLEEMRRRMEEARRAAERGEGGSRGEWGGPGGGAGEDGEGRPGGGAGPGGGAPGLELGPATDRSRMELRPESLPPGSVWDPVGMVFAVTGAVPNAPAGAPAGPGPAAAPGEGGPGQVTWKRDAWPQHQDVLRRYFTE